LKQKRTGFLRNLDKHCPLIGQFIETFRENLFLTYSISSLNIASGSRLEKDEEADKKMIRLPA